MKLLLVLLLAMSPLLAQESVPLTLDQAIDGALRQNPSIAAARHAVNAASARIKEARADYFPQVGFNGIAKAGLSGATNQLGLVGLPNSPFYRNLAGSLNAYQVLFDSGRRRQRVEFERRREEVAKADLRAAESAVVYESRRAFYEVLRAEKLRDAALEVVSSHELAVRQAQAFYDARLKSRVDFELAKAGLARSQLRLLQAENQVRLAMAALGRALGGRQDVIYVLNEPTPAITSSEPLNNLLAEAYQQRPELLALRAELEAARAAVALARSQRKPILSLAFAGGYARFTNVLARQLTAGGAGLILPLFTGGRLEGQIEEAEARVRTIENQEEELRQRVSFEVRDAYLRLEEAMNAVPMLHLQAEAARQAVRLASERYKERLGSLVELAQAQASLAEATRDEASGLFEKQVSQFKLLLTAGRTR